MQINICVDGGMSWYVFYPQCIYCKVIPSYTSQFEMGNNQLRNVFLTQTHFSLNCKLEFKFPSHNPTLSLCVTSNYWIVNLIIFLSLDIQDHIFIPVNAGISSGSQ